MTQAENDTAAIAATNNSHPEGEAMSARLRSDEALTPTPTQAQNDLAAMVACGPPPSALRPLVVDVPYVSGAGTVGETLTCTMGNWTGEPTDYAYQWKSDGMAELGSGASYQIGAGDAGHSITCIVTASNAGGSTVAPPSNAVLVSGAARSSTR